MTVKDLMKELAKHPADMDVIISRNQPVEPCVMEDRGYVMLKYSKPESFGLKVGT